MNIGAAPHDIDRDLREQFDKVLGPAEDWDDFLPNLFRSRALPESIAASLNAGERGHWHVYLARPRGRFWILQRKTKQ